MSSNNYDSTYYDPSTELADLGASRYDASVAAIDHQRDTALLTGQPNTVRNVPVPKAIAKKVFAWNTLQYTDVDRNEKEDMKEDLHGGQLHRQNRAARGEDMVRIPGPIHDAGFVRGGGRGGRRCGRGGRVVEVERGLRVAVKPDEEVRPEAKGFAPELSKDMFWDEPIV